MQPQLTTAVERFLALFEGIELHPPEIPYLSNVTGGWITAEEATDPASRGRKQQASGSRAPHTAALLGSGVYLESKREKRFLYVGVHERSVWLRKGTLGKFRTFDTTKTFATAAKALEAASAIVDEHAHHGFKLISSPS